MTGGAGYIGESRIRQLEDWNRCVARRLWLAVEHDSRGEIGGCLDSLVEGHDWTSRSCNFWVLVSRDTSAVYQHVRISMCETHRLSTEWLCNEALYKRSSKDSRTPFPSLGSHVVVTLLLSGKYLPVVVDNFHNSKPHAIQACEEIALEALGWVESESVKRRSVLIDFGNWDSADASQEEKDQCHVDLIKGDISDPAVFDGIFQRYSTQGGIYAVIHVAVSGKFDMYGLWLTRFARFAGTESCRRIRGTASTILSGQRICHNQPHAGKHPVTSGTRAT